MIITPQRIVYSIRNTNPHNKPNDSAFIRAGSQRRVKTIDIFSCDPDVELDGQLGKLTKQNYHLNTQIQ